MKTPRGRLAVVIAMMLALVGAGCVAHRPPISPEDDAPEWVRTTPSASRVVHHEGEPDWEAEGGEGAPVVVGADDATTTLQEVLSVIIDVLLIWRLIEASIDSD